MSHPYLISGSDANVVARHRSYSHDVEALPPLSPSSSQQEHTCTVRYLILFIFCTYHLFNTSCFSFVIFTGYI